MSTLSELLVIPVKRWGEFQNKKAPLRSLRTIKATIKLCGCLVHLARAMAALTDDVADTPRLRLLQLGEDAGLKGERCHAEEEVPHTLPCNCSQLVTYTTYTSHCEMVIWLFKQTPLGNMYDLHMFLELHCPSFSSGCSVSALYRLT